MNRLYGAKIRLYVEIHLMKQMFPRADLGLFTDSEQMFTRADLHLFPDSEQMFPRPGKEQNRNKP